MLTQNGPLARFVEDLGLLLPLICGPDWRDPTIVPMPLGDPSDVEIQTLRIAVHTDNGEQKAEVFHKASHGAVLCQHVYGSQTERNDVTGPRNPS